MGIAGSGGDGQRQDRAAEPLVRFGGGVDPEPLPTQQA
jgi:hypothetical protein